MNIRQISPSDPISALALEGLLRTAPMLNVLDFYAKGGAADSVKRQRESSNTTIFRSLNEANSATGPTPVYDPVTKRIVSFDAKVDVTLEDRNEDVNTELAFQTRIEAEAAGYVLQEKIFEGDNDNNAEEFDGLRNLVQASYIKTANDGSGMLVPVGNSDNNMGLQQTAIEQFLRFAATVKGGASHAVMNEYLKIRFLTVAKALGYYRLSKDELGSEIERIGDIQIIGAGYKADGTTLLPFTENVGDFNNSSSIFFMRVGERVDLTTLTSVGVKGRYSGQTGNFIVNNVNFDMAMHLQNHAALVQVKGWALKENAVAE